MAGMLQYSNPLPPRLIFMVSYMLEYSNPLITLLWCRNIMAVMLEYCNPQVTLLWYHNILFHQLTEKSWWLTKCSADSAHFRSFLPHPPPPSTRATFHLIGGASFSCQRINLSSNQRFMFSHLYVGVGWLLEFYIQTTPKGHTRMGANLWQCAFVATL